MTGLWPPYSRGLSEEISLSHYLSSAYTEVYSMEYRWKNCKIESIQERRSFPGQPVEELISLSDGMDY